MQIIYFEKNGDESAADQSYRGRKFLGQKILKPKFRDQNSWRQNVLITIDLSPILCISSRVILVPFTFGPACENSVCKMSPLGTVCYQLGKWKYQLLYDP